MQKSKKYVSYERFEPCEQNRLYLYLEKNGFKCDFYVSKGCNLIFDLVSDPEQRIPIGFSLDNLIFAVEDSRLQKILDDSDFLPHVVIDITAAGLLTNA